MGNMQKLSWALVGLLVGVLIATSMPVQAHHRYSVSRLKQRIEKLESKTRHLDYLTGEFDPAYLDKPSGCSNQPAVWEWTSGLDC